MRNPFFPSEYVSSAYSIDYERLYAEGYRGILYDIDNTLVPHGAPADERAVKLFSRLRDIGFKCCLVSNNKQPRVEPFAEAVGAKAVWLAHKPLTGGYKRGMSEMGTGVSDTLLIGDQIFTDLWGGTLIGLYTIMVKPINPKEEVQIVLKRILERPILWIYRHSKAYSHEHEMIEKQL